MKLPPICLGVFILSVAACKQEREIKVYKVAKETPAEVQAAASPAGDPHAGVPGMTPGATMPGGAAGADPHAGMSADQLAGGVSASGSPQVTDSPPAGWKKLPTTTMRQASYLIEGEGGATVDVSLIILRGAAGGNLDNVNRWRGQLGQAAIDEATLKQSAQTLATPVGPAIAVDIEGLAEGGDAKKDGRMVGVIANKSGDAWFYKMRGNAGLTAKEKDSFLQWVQSVKPAAPGEAPVGPAAIAPAPPASGTAVPAPAPADGSLSWEIPDGWTLVPATSSMRYATFKVSGAEGVTGELVVTHFPGDVGGDLENVNRWRQQVALPAIDQAALGALVSKLTAGPKTLSLIDVTGPQVRLAAGWTRHGADTWFFKFTGPDALVAAQKARFTAFLESIRFTKPE